MSMGDLLSPKSKNLCALSSLTICRILYVPGIINNNLHMNGVLYGSLRYLAVFNPVFAYYSNTHQPHVNSCLHDLCISAPVCLLDGVELTGAQSSSISGSKDKLVNTHAEVTYVFIHLPDSFSSPASPLQVYLCLLCPFFSTRLLFSHSLLVSTMNLGALLLGSV